MNEKKQSGGFLSNVHDPHDSNARTYLTYSYYALMSGQKAMEAEWQQHMNWVNENIICLPKATKAYTQQQLIAMNMVGIYAPAQKGLRNE